MRLLTILVMLLLPLHTLADGPGRLIDTSPGVVFGGLAQSAIKFVVAGGSAGNVTVSFDNGLTWSAATSISADLYRGDVLSVSGRATLVTGGVGAVAYSTNGVSWSFGTAGPGSAAGSGNVATCSASLCCGVRSGSGGTTYSSPDGITWTAQTMNTTAEFPSPNPYSVAYMQNLNKFITPVINGVNVSFAQSSDCVTWTYTLDAIEPAPSLFYPGTFGGGRALFCDASFANNCRTSTDGVFWFSVAAFPGGTGFNMVHNGTVFVMGDPDGSANVYTTTDGAAWTTRNPPAGTYLAVGVNGARIFAVGNNVAAFSDDNGSTWTSSPIPAGTWRSVGTN